MKYLLVDDWRWVCTYCIPWTRGLYRVLLAVNCASFMVAGYCVRSGYPYFFFFAVRVRRGSIIVVIIFTKGCRPACCRWRKYDTIHARWYLRYARGTSTSYIKGGKNPLHSNYFLALARAPSPRMGPAIMHDVTIVQANCATRQAKTKAPLKTRLII